MNGVAHQPATTAWELAGQSSAAALDPAASALVVGDDPANAAHAAIGIARVQSTHRRVVIANVAGEVAALEQLVTGDDPHGISDSFHFGVSLGRMAHAVAGATDLFVLSSGTDAFVTDEMLRSQRWRTYRDELVKSGALLLLLAPTDATRIAALTDQVDGAVVVGTLTGSGLRDVPILATIQLPANDDAGTIVRPAERRGRALLPRTPWRPAERVRSRWPLVTAVVLAAGALGAYVWPRSARDDRGRAAQPPVVAAPERGGAGVTDEAPDAGDATRASRNGALLLDSPVTAAAVLAVVNPPDSARAAEYAVLLSTFPTEERARSRLLRDAPGVPAATVSPAGASAGERHQYLSGAFSSRAEADSLLLRLRDRAAVGTRGGSVVVRPLAFLLADTLGASRARGLRRRFVERGIAAYALVQPDGARRIYAGAYANREQAALAAPALRRAGVEPVLAYRTGHPE